MNAANVTALLPAPVTFVTGKGGVGKSTVAGALAVALARTGLPTALVEFDDDEAGKRALQGADVVVDHKVISYDRALEGAIAPLLGGLLVARTLLRHGAVRRLVKAMPALREFVSLEAVRALVASGKYGRVVVDLPATGHAIDWLRVPGAFERFLLGGPLGALGRRIREEVIAAGRSDLVLVTLAEPLVVRETEQLVTSLIRELDRHVALLIVNRSWPRDSPQVLAAAHRLTVTKPDNVDVAAFEKLLIARAVAADDTSSALQAARAMAEAKVLSLPEAPTDPNVLDVLRWLNDGMDRFDLRDGEVKA